MKQVFMGKRNGKSLKCIDVLTARSLESSFKSSEDYMQTKVSEMSENTTKECNRLTEEYMAKRGLTLDDMEGNVTMQQLPLNYDGTGSAATSFWYKGELIFSVKYKVDFTQVVPTRVEAVIKKGDW